MVLDFNGVALHGPDAIDGHLRRMQHEVWQLACEWTRLLGQIKNVSRPLLRKRGGEQKQVRDPLGKHNAVRKRKLISHLFKECVSAKG